MDGYIKDITIYFNL